MPESIMWFVDGLRFLHHSQRLLLIVIILVLIVYIILYSNRFNKRTNTSSSLVPLVCLGVASCLVAQNADFIFAELSHDEIYTQFFSNLGAEIVAGVLIVVILNVWGEEHGLLYPNIIFLTVLILSFICVANCLFRVPYLSLETNVDKSILLNIALEFLSLCLILIPLMFGSRIMHLVLKKPVPWYERLLYTVMELLFAAFMICLVLAYVWLLYLLRISAENLLFTFMGSFTSFILIGSWIAKNDVSTVSLSILILVLIAYLVLGIIRLPFDQSISIAAELLGSLIFPIILERNEAHVEKKE